MIKNYVWTFVVKNFDQLFKFLVGMFLARKLLPEDFGVMAITIAIISILNSIVRFGFGSAIVQFNGSKLKDRFSSIFWFNLVLSVLMFLTLNVFSSSISIFFEQEVLVNIIRVVSILIIFESLILVQRSYLKKTLKFKSINKRLVTSTIISGITGCVMAYVGFGVWSLVAMTITSSFISLILYWFYSDWIPKFSYKYTDIKPILNFGVFRFFEILTKDIFKRLNTFFIGKFFDISLLGFYNKANSFSNTFLTNSISSINTVLYPHLSKFQNDDDKFYQIYNIVFSLITAFVFILSGIFMLWSFELVNLFFGPNWNKSAEILQIIALAGFVRPLLTVNSSLFLSKGYSMQSFNISLIYRIINIITVFIGIYFSFELFIYSFVIGEIFYFFINFYFIHSKLNNKKLFNSIVSIFVYLLPLVILFVLIFNFTFNIKIKLFISVVYICLGLIVFLIFNHGLIKIFRKFLINFKF